MTIQQSYPVVGMTCGHCVNAVTTELKSLPGVRDVGIDLRIGGVSSVSVISERELPYPMVVAAIEEAGYSLADPATASQGFHNENGGCCGGAGAGAGAGGAGAGAGHSASAGLHQIVNAVNAGGCCGGAGSPAPVGNREPAHAGSGCCRDS